MQNSESIIYIYISILISRRMHCNQGQGDHPLYVNVDMINGDIHNFWIDSLQASFAGIQVK